MRSRSRKVNTPEALAEPIEKRLGELSYESFSDYVNWLIIYDLSIRRPHHVTAELAKMSRAEIDRIHDEVARAFMADETLGGQWFEARIRDAVETLAAGKDVPLNKIVAEIRKRISK